MKLSNLLLEANKRGYELFCDLDGVLCDFEKAFKAFNLNVFLNETCKDAISMNEFINTLPIGIKELEDTARLGYSQGISKIFIDGLNNIDINKRPVHCGDLKREIGRAHV